MYEINKDSLCFLLDRSSDEVPHLLLIQELLDNGQAEEKNGFIHIPHEEICSLASIDQKILNLPDPYPFDIKISAKGMLQDPDFKLDYGFYEYDHGAQFFVDRIGSILKFEDGQENLLSLDQLWLCNAIDEFNSREKKELSYNLKSFGKIKDLALNANAILDSYLQNENVLVPNRISLKLSKGENEDLEISPDIEESVSKDENKKEYSNQFNKKFDKFSKIHRSYTIIDSEGKRVRIPLLPEQQVELNKVKKYHKVSGNLKEKIIENPQLFFDPDIIDLDKFSQRVIKIGLYKPKYIPFVTPYKSEWIPGIQVDLGDELKKIMVRDEGELHDLKQGYNEALKHGKLQVEWQKNTIPLEVCKEFLERSKEQLAKPDTPIIKTKKDKKVLIIEDNIFEDKYHEDKKQYVPEAEKFINRFEHPPFLKDGINLYKHQIEGIAWMESLFHDGYSGGLLADDMGLGKTLQILSFIDWHNSYRNPESRPYLIIAPLSILENWGNEFSRFFKGDLEVDQLHSSCRDKIIRSYLKIKRIYLTNYETVRNPDYQLILGQIDWAVVVTDEVQKIKTPGTLVTNAVKALKADFKIASTGTPVENSMLDLWCIMDFVVPGLLGSAKDFAKNYQTPINKGLDDNELTELGNRIRSEIGLYLMRRLKQVISSELPEKFIKRQNIEMPRIQRDLYYNELRRSKYSDMDHILTTIYKLRAISDHPFLMGYDIQMIPPEELVKTSARMQALIKILERVKQKGEKAIVFSEFHETQKILQKVISAKFSLKHISVINGLTAARKGQKSQKETRQDAIDKFSSTTGFNVIIMSPRAAGVGLNVAAANHVIHYSRHWNPAKESQATDRAYRIGQDKDVYVYYPLATLPDIKSFDIILDELLKFKRNIADAAMFPSAVNEVSIERFSDELGKSQKFEIDEKPLTLSDLNRFEPEYFKAAFGVIFQKKGFQVALTPKINNKGVDVIARSSKANLLIKTIIADKPVEAIDISKNIVSNDYYNTKFKCDFKIMIATNNEFNEEAIEYAKNNGISIFTKGELSSFFHSESIFLSEVTDLEVTRMKEV